MKIENSADDKFIMIDHLHRVIKVIMETKIDFYPMAVALDKNNMLKINVDIKTDDQPTASEMVLRYNIELNKMLSEKEIQGYCIAVDTITSKELNSKKNDTIVFMTKSDPEKEAEVIYYSYTLNKNGKFEITDIWSDSRILSVI